MRTLFVDNIPWTIYAWSKLVYKISPFSRTIGENIIFVGNGVNLIIRRACLVRIQYTHDLWMEKKRIQIEPER